MPEDLAFSRSFPSYCSCSNFLSLDTRKT